MSVRRRLARPNRRDLLIAALGVGGAAAALGGLRSLLGRDSVGSAERALGRLEGAPVDALETLGRRYLAASPGLGVEPLWDAIEQRTGPWTGSAAALRRRIVAAVERDFASGATVRLDGWIVAETTAWIGALAALASADGG